MVSLVNLLHIEWLNSLVAWVKSFLFVSLSHELVGLATMIFIIGVIGLLDSVDFFGFLVSLEVAMLGINFYLLT